MGVVDTLEGWKSGVNVVIVVLVLVVLLLVAVDDAPLSLCSRCVALVRRHNRDQSPSLCVSSTGDEAMLVDGIAIVGSNEGTNEKRTSS